MLKRNIALAALFMVVLGLVACDDPAEKGRAIVEITEVNAGSPVASSASTGEDLIPIVFTARPYNDYITGSEHSQIIIEKYSIIWTRTDGGTGNLATRSEQSHITVTVDKSTDAFIRLTTLADKNNPVLSSLVGTSNQITMRADIRFTGREIGTDKEVECATSLTVIFTS